MDDRGTGVPALVLLTPTVAPALSTGLQYYCTNNAEHTL